jgi:hypothetical protein
MNNDFIRVVTEEDFNKKVKQEDDFFDISNKIKRILSVGINNLKDSGLNTERTDVDDEELDSFLKDLCSQGERIGEKFVKGLGQMYKGVLIKDEISIREDGRVYRYRCRRSGINREELCKMLLQNKDEVVLNVGQERADIIFLIVNSIIKDVNGRRDYTLDIDTSIASGEKDIKSFNVFDFEFRGYSNDEIMPKGEVMCIKKMSFNRGRIVFEDERGHSIGNNIIHKMCIAKHKNVIKEIRDNVISQLQSKKNELNDTEKLLNDLMGKYLIAAELGTGGSDW